MFIQPITELQWAYQLHYYICFRTRRRRNQFDISTQISLSRTLEEVCTNHDYRLLQHKVYPDHLRCLLSLRPDQPISVVLNKIKSNTSREFCSEYHLTAPLWATGYLARSIGRVRIQAVKQYLSRQSEHHGYSARLNPPVYRYRCQQPSELRAAHSVFDLNYHMVLATRYRRSVFGAELGRELVDYWVRVASKRGFALDDATILPDHVHLVLRLVPKMTIEQCALSLMNNSQDWMVRQHPNELIRAGVDSLWQPSAYTGTCGRVTTAMIKSFLKRP
jgi:REP-associated tyrosine transposase